tara:strand:+ start:2286 stop:3062 length:777 start_codon:yes stop_codon:yes gene_type:complete
MPVADHRKATEAMLRIRDILVNGEEEPTREVKMALTCAGISVQRRVAFGNQADAVDHGTFFVTTLGLLFALVVMCNGDLPRPSGSSEDSMEVDADADEERNKAIATWETSSIESALRAAEGEESSSWGAVVRHPGTLCQACLTTAAIRCHEMNLAELANLGALFFRQSSAALMASLIDSAGAPCAPQAPSNFLTLSNLDFMASANANLDENLQSIADGADSEAGQTVCFTHFELFPCLRAHTRILPIRDPILRRYYAI